MQIPGHYINLDRAEARRAYMQGEIARLGLPVARMPAVDGSGLTDADMRRLHPRAVMHPMAKAEVACSLSHRNCWIKIAEAEARFGAVFEDDIAFSDDALAFLGDDGWLPDGADLIKIETTSRMVMLDRKTVPVEGRTLARLTSRHLGGGGYILSKACAARLVKATETIALPVDYALFDPAMALLPDVTVWQLNPAICVQQLRSRNVFLPAGIDWSELSKDRVALKKRGLAKLRREVTAPFVKLADFARQSLRAVLTGRRWKMVRFRK